MTRYSIAGRVIAIAAGAIALLGALGILVQDAIASGNWSLDHYLMPVVVCITVLAGHLIGKAMREWRLLSSIGFAMLFLMGTGLTVYMSVGRMAHTADTEDARAKMVAEQIDELGKEAQRVIGKRIEAEKMLNREMGLLARECGTGKGTKCKGIKASVDVYEAAVKGHDAELAGIREKVAAAGPVPVTDSRASRMASAIAVFAANEGQTKEKLTRTFRLFEPFATSLFLELTSIVAFGFGFSHRRKAKVAPAPDQAKATPVDPEPGPAVTVSNGPERRAAVHNFVATYQARHGQPPQLPDVQGMHKAKFGCDLPKTTAARWRREAIAAIGPVRRLRIVGGVQ